MCMKLSAFTESYKPKGSPGACIMQGPIIFCKK